MINDGTDLIRRHMSEGDQVSTLAYTDPFSMALGLPTGRCGPLWWDLNFNFDAATHPTAECAMGEAEWVLVPMTRAGEGCCQETVAVMLDLYSGYRSQHFSETARTNDWILLRRVD